MMEESTIMQLITEIRDDQREIRKDVCDLKEGQAVQGEKLSSIENRLSAIENDRFSFSKLVEFLSTRAGIVFLAILAVCVNYGLMIAGLPAIDFISGIKSVIGLL